MKTKIIILFLFLSPFAYGKSENKVFLGDLKPVKEVVGWKTLMVNSNPFNLSVEIENKPCYKYLFAHAASSISYLIPEGVKRFIAYGVMPTYRGEISGSWEYVVRVDGKVLYRSKALSSYKNNELRISIKIPNGAKKIELITDDMGDSYGDQCIWAEPYFILVPHDVIFGHGNWIYRADLKRGSKIQINFGNARKSKLLEMKKGFILYEGVPAIEDTRKRKSAPMKEALDKEQIEVKYIYVSESADKAFRVWVDCLKGAWFISM